MTATRLFTRLILAAACGFVLVMMAAPVAVADERSVLLVVDEQGAEVAKAEGPGSAIRPGEASRSATIIREIAKFGGDVSHFVDPSVAARLRARVAER